MFPTENLALVLEAAGAKHLEPLFAAHAIADDILATISEHDLIEIGVAEPHVRDAVLAALRRKIADEKQAAVAHDRGSGARLHTLNGEGAEARVVTDVTSDTSGPAQEAVSAADAARDGAASASTPDLESTIEHLRRAHALHQDGILSDVEFHALKARLMGLDATPNAKPANTNNERSSPPRIDAGEVVGTGSSVDSRGTSPPVALPGESVRKNRVVAILLALFLGEFGVDRFYSGHAGLGATKLTLFVLGPGMIIAGAMASAARRSVDELVGFAGAGVFVMSIVGVWWFIDLILFAVGAVKVDGRGRRIIWE
jgi:TM2 domain-containing membrane protein YozV